MTVQMNLKSSETAEQSVVKDQLNYLNSMNDTPAVRLDAEFYQADDIDGAADGLSGSGNLNYLVLQSQQTHDASVLNSPFQILNGDQLFDNSPFGGGPSAGHMNGSDYGHFSDEDNGLDLGGNAGDFTLGAVSGTGQDIPGLGTGLGITGASALKARGFHDGGDVQQSATEINIYNTPPTDPKPPVKPPEGPPDNPVTDDYDLVVDVDTPIFDVDLDVVLDPIEAIVGDIDIDIDAIIDQLLPGDHGILPDISASIDAVLGGTTLLGVDLDEILEPLDPLLSGTANLLDDIIVGVEGLLPHTLIQPITEVLNTVVDLTGLNGGSGDTDLLLNLGAIIPEFAVFDSALDVPLNPVEVLLGDIDITVDAQVLVEDLGVHTFSIIEDLHTLDVQGVLETVTGDEGILQNIDGIVPELDLGVDIITDILPDFSGDISSLDILGFVTDTVEAILHGHDGDLTVGTELDVLGLEVLDIDLDVPLDPVEAIIGDIDIDIGLASLINAESVSDILNDALATDIDGILDDLGTGLGIDTHLDLLSEHDIAMDIPTDLSGLSDAVGSLLGGSQIPDVLPDPVGTITEGLGSVVDTTPILGGLGGLLHGGGGGLFG